MATITDWVERIDAELAANEAESDPNDPTIEILVELGKLPKEALEKSYRTFKARKAMPVKFQAATAAFDSRKTWGK